MASYVTVTNGSSGDEIQAEHINQFAENAQGLRNIPLAYTGINDAAVPALTLKNAGTGSKGLLVYAADGTTVLLQVDGSGVLASRTGGAAERVLTTGESGTINATMIANRTRRKFIPAGAFLTTQGTPSFVNQGGIGYWLLDASVSESVSTSAIVDSDWTSGTYTVYLYIAPNIAGAAGSREVNLNLETSVTSSGSVAASGSTTDTISTGATTGELLIVAHSRTLTVASVGQLIGLTLTRLGADAADDLASDLRFAGVGLEYTADS